LIAREKIEVEFLGNNQLLLSVPEKNVHVEQEDDLKHRHKTLEDSSE